VSVTIIGEVAWSDDFIVIDCSRPLREVLKDLDDCVLPWLVVSRHGGSLLYVLHPDELRRYLPARPTQAQLAAATERVLRLQETQASTSASNRFAPPPIDRAWRPQVEAPSIDRLVEVDARGAPQAVGSPVLTARRGRRVTVHADELSVAAAPPPSRQRASRGLQRAEPPEAAEPPAAATAAEATADEGDTPIRHPSIEIDAPFVAGQRVVITVDLAREAVSHTQGGPVAVGTLAADWQTLELTVHLQCAALDLVATQATVTMRRNAASLPARFEGLVRADAAPGMVPVVATFLIGTRWCGGGVRLEPVAQVGSHPAPTGHAAGASQGVVALDPGAAQPDLMVHIGKLDRSQPGRLRFLCVTPRFDGLPPRLEEDIDLGRDPADEASALFKEFAVLERGQHRKRIEGFGSRLWALAPPMLRAVYWALWDRHQRELSIQFVSDEPHLPWELMRPVRDDESEVHAPLALAHATARWIKRWDGFMRQRVPAGRICTIAPKYASVSRALKRAQIESDKLVADFGARKEAGTRAAVLALLEAAPPPEALAVLHFAGHGVFAADAASHSAIKLEDGDLAAAEVERPEVRLGRACRTLVFFNACEVGAAGAVFGEVGGWADAFLGRQFGGFIAPLWSVDDEDAGVVAADLLQRICRNHEPVGAALRAVRAAHGDTSPTFYSYLYYGDVLARIGA
jgi:hypothetical protein